MIKFETRERAEEPKTREQNPVRAEYMAHAIAHWMDSILDSRRAIQKLLQNPQEKQKGAIHVCRATIYELEGSTTNQELADDVQQDIRWTEEEIPDRAELGGEVYDLEQQYLHDLPKTKVTHEAYTFMTFVEKWSLWQQWREYQKNETREFAYSLDSCMERILQGAAIKDIDASLDSRKWFIRKEFESRFGSNYYRAPGLPAEEHDREKTVESAFYNARILHRPDLVARVFQTDQLFGLNEPAKRRILKESLDTHCAKLLEPSEQEFRWRAVRRDLLSTATPSHPRMRK